MKAKLFDIKSFLSTLTFTKIINYLKLNLFYCVSLITRKSSIRGMPSKISIEPTTHCNLRCLECPSGQGQLNRPSGNIDGKLFRRIIDQSYKYLLSANIYFQGEPLLHKYFFKMVKYAHEKNIYTITSTNAHHIDQANAERIVSSGLNKIIISLDGITQETYSEYRVGGNIDKVFEGIVHLVKAKKSMKSKTPYIIVQFLINKKNEHEVEETKVICKKLGINNLTFKSMQLINNNDMHGFLPENSKYSRYSISDNGSLIIKNKLSNKCYRMWSSCVITWDGDLVPCCFDKDSSFVMGNLANESLQKVWRNEKYKSFRSRILKNRKSIAICRNCTVGLKK